MQFPLARLLSLSLSLLAPPPSPLSLLSPFSISVPLALSVPSYPLLSPYFSLSLLHLLLSLSFSSVHVYHPFPHRLSFSVHRSASSSLAAVNLFKRDSTPSMRIRDPSRIRCRCAVSRRSDSPHARLEIARRATTPAPIPQSLTLIDRPRSHPTAPTLYSARKICN